METGLTIPLNRAGQLYWRCKTCILKLIHLPHRTDSRQKPGHCGDRAVWFVFLAMHDRPLIERKYALLTDLSCHERSVYEDWSRVPAGL